MASALGDVSGAVPGGVHTQDHREDNWVEEMTPMKMRQCECGAYRQAAQNKKGKWVWAAGCRACDTIERLRQLLAAGVKVYDNQHRNPDELRRKAEEATMQVADLRNENVRLRIELDRAEHSKRAAQNAVERLRDQQIDYCDYSYDDDDDLELN